MRSAGRFFFLALIFIGSFWWAGGSSLLSGLLPHSSVSAPVRVADSQINTDIANIPGRLSRIINLRNAVADKITTKHYVHLQDIPLSMQQAIIAVEDNRFYHHFGLDAEGILRAALVNMQTGSIQEGGSTITQQLAKNLFLSQDQTLSRKAEEVVLSVDLELHYSKEEILELYLNSIYFGAGAYGINDAARIYFGKTPQELNLAESALLAGIVNAPSAYSPYVDMATARERQAVVLAAMVRGGYIGPNAAQEAKQAPIHLNR